MDKDLLEKIKVLNKGLQTEALEKLLETALQKEPKDIELWFKLAIVELIPPLADYYKSIECLNKILEYDHNNPYALLLMAYIYDTRLGGVDDVLFNRLCEVHVENKELQSLIELAKAWHYRFPYYLKNKDGDLYEKFMLKSIELCKTHVYSYLELARYYINEGKKKLAIKLLKRALQNITIIYTRILHKEDYTDVNEYIDENIKGVHITDMNYDGIKTLLKNTEEELQEKNKI